MDTKIHLASALLKSDSFKEELIQNLRTISNITVVYAETIQEKQSSDNVNSNAHNPRATALSASRVADDVVRE